MFDDDYFVQLGDLRGICDAATLKPWRQGESSGSDWSPSTQVFDADGRQVAVCGNNDLIQCQWNARFIAAASKVVPRLIEDILKLSSLVDGQHEETFDRMIGQLEKADANVKQLEARVAQLEAELARRPPEGGGVMPSDLASAFGATLFGGGRR